MRTVPCAAAFVLLLAAMVSAQNATASTADEAPGNTTASTGGVAPNTTASTGGAAPNTTTNACASAPCQNNGVCYVVSAPAPGYWCACAGPWTGAQCQFGGAAPNTTNTTASTGGAAPNTTASTGGAAPNTTTNACVSAPCRNGGTCYRTANNSFVCTCAAGFSGGVCQTNVNECASAPCLYNGTCIDQVNGFQCVCPPGRIGARCQFAANVTSSTGGAAPNNTGSTGVYVNVCASLPCRNGGQCRQANGSAAYTCDCQAGFQGRVCETNVNECASRPCQNGGTCFDGINLYFCSCPRGYIGAVCQTPVATPPVMLSRYPSNGNTEVSVEQRSASMTFDQIVEWLPTGRLMIVQLTPAWSNTTLIASTRWLLAGPANASTGVTGSGATNGRLVLSIPPAVINLPATRYAVLLTADSVGAVSTGVNFPGLGLTAWTFTTTDQLPPSYLESPNVPVEISLAFNVAAGSSIPVTDYFVTIVQMALGLDPNSTRIEVVSVTFRASNSASAVERVMGWFRSALVTPKEAPSAGYLDVTYRFVPAAAELQAAEASPKALAAQLTALITTPNSAWYQPSTDPEAEQPETVAANVVPSSVSVTPDPTTGADGSSSGSNVALIAGVAAAAALVIGVSIGLFVGCRKKRVAKSKGLGVVSSGNAEMAAIAGGSTDAPNANATPATLVQVVPRPVHNTTASQDWANVPSNEYGAGAGVVVVVDRNDSLVQPVPSVAYGEAPAIESGVLPGQAASPKAAAVPPSYASLVV